jgi:tRNA (guanine-N7-)-methyltransferase
VLRKGRVTQGQNTALNTLLGDFIVPAGEIIVGREKSGFAAAAPLWLEIGFGNGDMLMSLATSMPAVNFIGVEVYRTGVGRLLQNLQKNDVRNVRVVIDDAVVFLTEQIAEGALDQVLLMFPDPWHKTRHHKRRIVNAEFADLLVARLAPGGIFHAATDSQSYARTMLKVLDKQPGLINLGGTGQYSPSPDYRIETRFEQRGRALGHGVWDLIYRRAGDRESNTK